MDNSIINKEDAFEDLLSEEHYFQSLLQVLNSNDLLDIKSIENIQLQVVDILREKVVYYTMDESSSIRVEVAEQIMLSIYYTIGIYLKEKFTIKESVDLIKGKSIKYLFSQGEKVLKEEFKECQKKLEHAQETRLMVENYAYTDTIDYGIPLFFKEYDIRFASHITQGSIDYPLAIDEMKLVGIQYIDDYLSKINLENKFCSYFDNSEIEALLKGFDKNSYDMLINIFQLVLTNYLGRVFIGKLGKSLEITEADRVCIKERLENLSEVEFQRLNLMVTEKLCAEFSIEDTNFNEYINKTVTNIIPAIKNSIETNTLENIFITLCKTEENTIRYEDGESLENSIFRSITEEIRDCKRVEDKIKIIREEFHSLKDLVDVLSADCIFNDEFIDIFKVLDDFEIALLLKNIPSDEVMDSNYGTKSENEWHEKLRWYLEGFDDVKKQEIIGISKGIDI
jgi:hypothetical protein